MIQISVCLSKLPKEKITTDKNGNKWISLMLTERKEVGNYGETHALKLSKSKEERAQNVPEVYVGSGRDYLMADRRAKAVNDTPIWQPNNNNKQQMEDNLPF